MNRFFQRLRANAARLKIKLAVRCKSFGMSPQSERRDARRPNGWFGIPLLNLRLALPLAVSIWPLVLSQLFCGNLVAQIAPGWPVGAPPPFQGPTFGATLRNAAQATSVQARLTRQTAGDMGRRARSAGYQLQTFWTDYQNLQFQFQGLRATFNVLGELVLQLQNPRAANAVAELDAGLNIIAEAFTPIQQEIQAGMLNRDTVVRTCRVLDQVLGEWDRELKRNSSRLQRVR